MRKREALRAKRRASLIVARGRLRGKMCKGAQEKIDFEVSAY